MICGEIILVPKVYVDSKIRSRGSDSTAGFEFELSQSLQLPNPCRCYIVDIIVPHSWFGIDERNSHIHINTFHDNAIHDIVTAGVLSVNNYMGNSFAGEIKLQLGAHFEAMYAAD